MATFHVISGASEHPVHPVIRKIGPADLKEALSQGWDDFRRFPTQLVFISLIYPIIGFVLGRMAIGYAVLPLLFPLMAGFALVGPLAAVGLYELSRRREAGLETHWYNVFDVLKSPSIGAIAGLGIMLMIIFIAWLYTAQGIYEAFFGDKAPDSAAQFASEVLNTSAGWKLILYGNAAGFLFALVTLVVSAISFPLLLDRDVGAAVAVETSIRAALKNPITMALWGIIVATLLVIGSVPFFIGLAVVMPVLGHATWHLYRKVVEH
jgi:uncharacterized membrane protein